MSGLTHSSIGREIDGLARRMAAARAAEDEALVKVAVGRWLRPRLRWLVEHPDLLRLYMRLPHRRVPVLRRPADPLEQIAFGMEYVRRRYDILYPANTPAGRAARAAHHRVTHGGEL